MAELLKFRVISGTIWNSISSGFTFFLGIGTMAVLARLLSPADFGLLAMIQVVINILESFSDMGVSAAVISYRDVTSRELSSLFYFNIIVGIFLTLLLIAVSPLVVLYYNESRIYLYIWILALNFTITSPATIFNVLLKKHMKFEVLSKITIACMIAYSVGTIILALIFRNVMSLVLGALIQGIVYTVLNIYSGLKLWKPGKAPIKYTEIKRFISFGLYQVGQRMINRFNRNVDYLLVGRYLGADMLGYYSLAYNFMLKPIEKINPIVTSVAFPALSEIQQDTAKIKLYFLKMIKYICYVTAPIYLMIFVFSENIILFLYGDKWLQSVPILSVFALLGILYAIGNPMGNLILAKGRADIGFWVTVFQTLFLIAANYIGLQWGGIGVAMSTLLVTLFVFVPVGFYIRHYLVEMGVGEYLSQVKTSLMFSIAAAAAVLLFQEYILALPLVEELFILSALFGIVYVVLLGLFDKDEFRFLWKTLKEYIKNKKAGQNA